MDSAAEEAGTEAPAPAEEAPPINDFDRDSLYCMPLSIVPIQTHALSHARLIKNVHLVGVIEVFKDAHAGSGQLHPDKLSREFGWPPGQSHPDDKLIHRLSVLPSYDVYSLRILLRKYDIPIQNIDGLRLSESKAKELTRYMRDFTRPLMREVYSGEEAMEIMDLDGLMKLFRNPDKRKALENLQKIADKLKIGIQDVPKFLEDYGDIFLSLAYYKNCVESLIDPINDFIESIDEVRGNFQLKRDENLMKICDYTQDTINDLLASISARIENFYRATGDMWTDISAEKFRRVETMIKSYHVSIGGALCSLSVKMNVWNATFPNRRSGSPVKRSEFIMSQMRSGLETIRKLDEQGLH